LAETLQIFKKEEVDATSIGKLTSDRRLQLFFEKEVVADLKMSFIFNPPESQKKASYKKPKFFEPKFSEPKNLTKYFLRHVF